MLSAATSGRAAGSASALTMHMRRFNDLRLLPPAWRRSTAGWNARVMEALLDQLLPLVGVGIGIGGTILTSRLNDHSRRRREDVVRSNERRLDAYVRFAQSLKYVYHLATRLIEGRQAERSGVSSTSDRAHGVALLSDAEGERTKAWEIVLLLGDEETVTAAREWRGAVWRLELAARGHTRDDFDHAAAVRRVDACRDKFYAAARASLGVSGGDVAQSTWLMEEAPWLPGDPA
jgi:hypothetical protein